MSTKQRNPASTWKYKSQKKKTTNLFKNNVDANADRRRTMSPLSLGKRRERPGKKNKKRSTEQKNKSKG